MAGKRKFNWEKTPEWQRQVERVLACKEKGMDLPTIAAIIGAKEDIVKRIIEDEKQADIIAKDAYKEKIPTIESIIALSLSSLNAVLKDMASNPKLRNKIITKVSDISLLVKAVESLNTLLRLELHKSTQNILIQNSYQQTRRALQDIQKIDPVFEYPELPEPKDGK